MLEILSNLPSPAQLAGSAEGAAFVKYMAAALVASQGSLIATYGIRVGGSARNICMVVGLLHYVCAGLIFWWSW